MALVNNPWVGYLDRGFEQIKSKLLARLGVVAPELTDHTENDPLIINVSMFSGVAEMLNYYIDNLGRESFIDTARKFKSLVSLVRVLDYRILARSYETVDVTFTLSDPAPVGGATIPLGTRLTGATLNFEFITTADLVIPEGDTAGIVGAAQYENQVGVNLGNTDGSKNQVFNLGSDYVHNTAELEIGGIPYGRAETFAYMNANSEEFIVEISKTGEANVTLGDNIKGKIPTTGQTVLANFRTTLGSEANIGPEEITDIVNPPVIPGVTTITATNEAASSGGSDIESVDSIRRNAPISIRTLYRAVSNPDYRELALLKDGVAKSDVFFECGKTVDVFIGPEAGNEGGIASVALLQDVEAFFEDKRMNTTKVRAIAAGIGDLYLDIIVRPKFRRDPVQTQNDVTNALLDEYGYIKQNINSQFRLSDMLALVDNLDKVEFANVIKLYLRPYARPLNHLVQLDWTRDIKPTAVKSEYKLSYNSSSSMVVIKDNVFQAVINPGDTYSDDNIEFTIIASALYEVGMEWVFTNYTYNTDIEVDDFSVPVLKAANLTVQIDSQNVQF